eukprot:9650369-Alexandrium_andersonii.AAC.1
MRCGPRQRRPSARLRLSRQLRLHGKCEVASAACHTSDPAARPCLPRRRLPAAASPASLQAPPARTTEAGGHNL